MAQKHLETVIRQNITILFWFALTFLSQNSFQVSQVIATEKIIPSRDTKTGEKTVIIIRSQQIAAYNEAIKGFKEGCKGKNISVKTVYDLNGDTEAGKKIIHSIRDDKLKPDLILAVGVLAATLAKEQFTDVPIIFCMVINHERFNLQGANITGISAEASIEDQLAILKEILGTQKRIGVIYDPTGTGKIITEATRVAKKYEFNLITKEVVSEREVLSALDTIINKIDALWIIPDSTVITKVTLDPILKGTLKHRLPTFCTSSAIVKAGALASISIDYAYTGLQAAEIAQTLLSNITAISPGVKQPEKLKLSLNTKTAEQIGINISSLRSRSDVVLYP